jgi:NADH:ubiquinone oxidoreductase subunit 5 (subunit L)/multisubunit Na+/H+ antiporter MnhA subunit
MNAGFHPLIVVTFSPLLGVVILLLLKREQKMALRWAALLTSLVTFTLSLWMLSLFNPAEGGYQMELNLPAWVKLGSLQVGFHFGVDGISLLMVLLTTFLTPLAILSTWTAVTEKVKGFMTFFLLLEMGMLGVFLSLDLVLFYIFWEFTLVPMVFLIGVWGGERRIYAAVKFFLFTMTGSVLMLLAILVLGWSGGTFFTPRPGSRAPGFCRDADLALPGICAGLCHQSSGLAAAYLAAGCSCRGSNCRFGHSGRCPVKNGRLRFSAFQPAAFPGDSRQTGSLDGTPGCDRNLVWRGSLLCPKRS